MALVDYSGSEESDEEQQPVAKQPLNSKAKSTKSDFHKIVDPSEPHKIRVSLPETFTADDAKEQEHPAKRAKIGSGGFNSLLPAPKRAIVTNGGPLLGDRSKGRLGSGVSLKTGATPGFTREPEPAVDRVQEISNNDTKAKPSAPALESTPYERPNVTETPGTNGGPTQDLKLKGKPTMFKPLSVARKPKKKAIHLPGSEEIKIESTIPGQPNKSVSKVSLFSSVDMTENLKDNSSSKEPYQPMLYEGTDTVQPNANGDHDSTQEAEDTNQSSGKALSAEETPHTLDAIASDLKLSASAKRQLLGRQKNHTSAINIINFNTDEEYTSNEALRQSGEQVQHNPVRAIAPGKHSLKQLVNMGTSQADALEESFATGRRNRSEAGSKYGW